MPSYPNVIATGIPIISSETTCHPEPLEPPTSYLDSLGLPDGLKASFLQSARDFPLRIWIVDNSGSMMTGDGNRTVTGPGGREGVVSCSRWAELGDALLWHGTLAAHLHAPTEFRVLNPPANGAPQCLTVGAVESEGSDISTAISAVQHLVGSSPTGRTPLCEQIRTVTQRIQAQADTLRRNGQRAVVVVASDGAATDGDVAAAMRPLQSLPVWVVIRLCTDDTSVVDYWNKIDEDLELDMDVLDDLCGEAAEVTGKNSWLNYSAHLHRLREWGCANKVFDIIDEQALTVAEMTALVECILGNVALDLPSAQLDWDGFAKGLRTLQMQTAEVWDPLRKCKRPWFDERRLRNSFAKGLLVECKGCAIM